MKAVYFEEYGGSEVLRYGERPEPTLAANQVLIEVHAASINPRDWLIRGGRYFARALLPRRPFVLGSDVAGVVSRVGRRVRGFQPGDQVFAMQPTRDGFGGYAERIAVRTSAVAKMATNQSFAEAAAVPLAALTALQALRNDARLRPGARVVVIGASGGVGSFAVQIARCLGAAEVIGVCSAANAERVLDLGADGTVDYKQERFQERLTGFDVVFDTIGRESLAGVAAALTRRGSYVTTVPTPTAALASLRTRLGGQLFGRRSRMVLVSSRGTDLDQLRRWIEAGQLRSVLDRLAPLERAAELHDYSRSFRTRGKNVLLVRPGADLRPADSSGVTAATEPSREG